jgi:hypothetical protein
MKTSESAPTEGELPNKQNKKAQHKKRRTTTTSRTNNPVVEFWSGHRRSAAKSDEFR